MSPTPTRNARNHLKAWSEAWREHFTHEDAASLRLQCFWRVMAAKMELRFLLAQDRVSFRRKDRQRVEAGGVSSLLAVLALSITAVRDKVWSPCTHTFRHRLKKSY